MKSFQLPIFFVAVFITAFIGGAYLFKSVLTADYSDITASFLHGQEAAVERAFQNETPPPPAADSVKVPIFIYHSVRQHFAGESATEDAYDITPELLDSQLHYLSANHFTTISPGELRNHFLASSTLPAKPVILTFDDGWHNQYKNAFPLIKKYGMTATFFIYTSRIGDKHFLSWSEVNELSAAGMNIGSHTVTHPFFRTTPLAQIRTEVFESKKIIEEKIGRPVSDFASPFGYTDKDIQDIIRDAGYKTARTTYKGVYHTKDDLLKLRGILVSDNLQDFIDALNR